MEKDKLIQNRKYHDTLYCTKRKYIYIQCSLLVHSLLYSIPFYRKITYLYSVDPLIITHSRVFHTKIIIINDNISFLTNILTYRINYDDNLDYECI